MLIQNGLMQLTRAGVQVFLGFSQPLKTFFLNPILSTLQLTRAGVQVFCQLHYFFFSIIFDFPPPSSFH